MAHFSLPFPFVWSPNPEQSLIRRASGGDRAAFDDLARRHLPALSSFIAKRSADAFVDDVVQETLLAAWLALPRYQPRATFKTWLFRIALNKLTDAARQSATRVRHEQTFWNEKTDGDTSLAHAENRMLAQALLSELDDEERTLLELYYRDGLTFAEIADLLERNLSTIKHRFYRLHVRLANQIGNDDGEVRHAARASAVHQPQPRTDAHSRPNRKQGPE